MHSLHRSLSLALALAAAAWLVPARATVLAQDNTHPGEYTPVDIENGARLYSAQCAACHAANGAGVGGIDLRRGMFRRVASDQDLRRVIAEGVPGSGMPKFDFNAAEQQGVVAYIRAGFDVGQVVGPRMVVLELDRRLSRRVPVSSRIEWTQPSAARPIARIVLEPANVTVTGPARVVTRLDTVALAPVRLDGRRDSLRVDVWPGGLPEGCIMEPPAVRLLVVLGRAHP